MSYQFANCLIHIFIKKRRKNHNKIYYNCNDHIKLSKNERILMMIQLKSLENLTSHVAHYWHICFDILRTRLFQNNTQSIEVLQNRNRTLGAESDLKNAFRSWFTMLNHMMIIMPHPHKFLVKKLILLFIFLNVFDVDIIYHNY